MTLAGNGASFTVQQEAGIVDADLLIAVTESDELNLLCCVIARKGGHCRTIARVRNSLYSQEINFIKDQLGISMIINPELTAANEIEKILRFPSALRVDTFAKGKAEILTYRLKSEYGFSNMTIQQAIEKLKSNVLICGVERGNEEFYIPNGMFVLKDQDTISIMASPKDAMDFTQKIGIASRPVKNVLIIGGSKTGYYLASLLLEKGIRVRIIEQDVARCEELSRLLPKAGVVNADGTDQQLLLREGLMAADAVVSLTGIDEENILVSLFATKNCGAKVVAKVNNIAFHSITSDLDIGSIVYPKYLTANTIIKYVRSTQNSMGSNVETLYKIMNNNAEALEFIIRPDCTLTDTPLMDLQLKPGLLVSCINRNGHIIIPRGADSIRAGDTVVIVTTQKGLRDISDILR